MKNRLIKDRRTELLAAAVLLALGCAVRLVHIGSLPYGLNQDEASAGYEAFALLRDGIDRCGNSWPVLLVSWGSGQNVLMTYIAMPFVALLGLSELSIRLPNAIAGCLTLLVFWRLARRCGGVHFGLLALGLLAVNPWHIMASRWALESNLLPFFLLTGVWLAVLARERPWALLGAAASFGLSLYAYGTAFFFLPPFLICAVILLRKQLKPAPFLTALLLFAVLALPIGLCQLINVLRLDEVRVLGVTLPRLTESRQTATSVFGGGEFPAALENFRLFLKLLWQGGDGLPYNALPFWRGGIFYFFGLPTAAIGFISSVFQRKDRREEGLMRAALLCALVCTFLIRGNVNRLNMIWLPLIYFSALGCNLLLQKLGRWAALPLLGVLACFLVFVSFYCTAFGGSGNVNYFPGLGNAIKAANALGGETIYITDRVNQPYIFALFYTRTPPGDFAAGVQYADQNAAFRQVRRFDGFEFQHPERADLLILFRTEAEGEKIIARSGDFVICEGSP